MIRYRFAVEYLGSEFSGWQIQDQLHTVQGALEAALKVVLKGDYRITGSGRTDAGVHSRGQVAHVDLPENVDLRKLTRSLNALCGPNLAVRGLEPCPSTFHARYAALTRRYSYTITQRHRPLDAGKAWLVSAPLDFKALTTEMEAGLGEHDFVRFCIPRNDGKSTLCHVVRFDASFHEGFIRVHIEANRFLHRMVRALVGAVVEVARGAAQPGLIAQNLGQPVRPSHWTWAPAHGLCLEKVSYADYDPDVMNLNP